MWGILYNYIILYLLYLLYLLCLYLANGSNRPLSGLDTHRVHSDCHPFAIYLTPKSHGMCKAVHIPSMICDMKHNITAKSTGLYPTGHIIMSFKPTNEYPHCYEGAIMVNEAGVNFGSNVVTSLVPSLDEEYGCRIIIWIWVLVYLYAWHIIYLYNSQVFLSRYWFKASTVAVPLNSHELTPNSISKPSSLLRCISLTWAKGNRLDTYVARLIVSIVCIFISCSVHRTLLYQSCDCNCAAEYKN